MALYAPHVHSDPARIALLETLLDELPEQACVVLVLRDGSRVAGRVSARPELQPFLDHDEHEGMNAMVRLDDLGRPEQRHMVWLDSIEEVVPVPWRDE